jgi:hypothetical protein
LGNFYFCIEIPEEGRIIIDTLINSLRKNSKNNLKEISIIEHIKRLLRGFIGISRSDENINHLIDKEEIIPLLFDLINTSSTDIYENAICLLRNICYIPSVEERNNIIKNGVFNILHKKLLEISPPPPQKILSHNYRSIGHIIGTINNLLHLNSTGASFFNTLLIPVLLCTLDSTITLTMTSSDEDIYDIQECICGCFVNVSSSSYNNVCRLIESKVIDCMINIIEKYILQIKENKIIIKVAVVEYGANVISNTTSFGSNESSSSEGNKFKKLFEKENKLNKLVDSFKFLNSLTSISPIQKSILDHISISICLLLKQEKPPRSYDVVISYINTLRLSPRPTSKDDYDFPLAAQNAWDNIKK